MSSVFRVGDRVGVSLGRRTVPGIITEDRGPLGVRGRRLYQVRVSMDPFEPVITELLEDDIQPIEHSALSEFSLDKKRIIAYLVNGGLIAILRSNLAGGRTQPRVWLRPDSIGNVTYTFEEEWGVVGGATIPFLAVHGEKVFSPKRVQVLALLQSFDLDRAEAEEILAAVGTAP